MAPGGHVFKFPARRRASSGSLMTTSGSLRAKAEKIAHFAVWSCAGPAFGQGNRVNE
jgi:hypothetical protein